MLSSGPVDLPERQRTLGGTLDWTYELLQPAEKSLFRRLAVFVGGWTLEAAESVCSSAELPAEGILQHMSVLADSSLIRRLDESGHEPRFGMLETLREYALEQLQAEAEDVEFRNRHLAFFSAMVEAMEPNLHGGHKEASADRVEREIDNLRAAIAWSLRSDQAVLGLRLVTTLRFFWYMRGHQHEAGEYLQAALMAADATADAATRGRALATLGYMLTLQGQYAAARPHLVAALAIGREQGDVPDLAFALRYLGLIDSTGGEYQAATEFLEESLTLYRQLDSPADVGLLLSYLGDLAIHLQDFERAQRLLEESSALLTRIRYMLAMPWPRRRLAHIARLRGDFFKAVRLCEESLAINLEVNEVQGVPASLVALAQVAEARGKPFAAVQMLGKADAVVGPSGLQLLPFDGQQHELITSELRSQRAESVWASAWHSGRELSLEEAIESVRAVARATSSDPEPGSAALTERQCEILRLLALGQTNRVIAEALSLSVATVERHLANIYARIGARGRAAATLYAVRAGLVVPPQRS